MNDDDDDERTSWPDAIVDIVGIIVLGAVAIAVLACCAGWRPWQ